MDAPLLAAGATSVNTGSPFAAVSETGFNRHIVSTVEAALSVPPLGRGEGAVLEKVPERDEGIYASRECAPSPAEGPDASPPFRAVEEAAAIFSNVLARTGCQGELGALARRRAPRRGQRGEAPGDAVWPSRRGCRAARRSGGRHSHPGQRSEHRQRSGCLDYSSPQPGRKGWSRGAAGIGGESRVAARAPACADGVGVPISRSQGVPPKWDA